MKINRLYLNPWYSSPHWQDSNNWLRVYPEYLLLFLLCQRTFFRWATPSVFCCFYKFTSVREPCLFLWGVLWFIFTNSRVGKRISAQAAHRTVLDSLPSYGSCYPIMLLFPIASDKTVLVALLVLPDILPLSTSLILACIYWQSTSLFFHSHSRTVLTFAFCKICCSN